MSPESSKFKSQRQIVFEALDRYVAEGKWPGSGYLLAEELGLKPRNTYYLMSRYLEQIGKKPTEACDGK